jgi:hypothetical protein
VRRLEDEVAEPQRDLDYLCHGLGEVPEVPVEVHESGWERVQEGVARAALTRAANYFAWYVLERVTVAEGAPAGFAGRAVAALGKLVGVSQAPRRVPLSTILRRIGLSATLVTAVCGRAVVEGGLHLLRVATWKGKLRHLVEEQGEAALTQLAPEICLAAGETLEAIRRFFAEEYGR